MARKPKQIADKAPLPEADCLQGYAHPREVMDLYGHKEQLSQIQQAWKSGRMHHAWMLTGPAGIGKATFAYHMARIILSYDMKTMDSPPLESLKADDHVSRQIMALSHPNLLLIRRNWNEKDKRFPANITVDEVRKLRSFVNMTAEEGSWRVVIVDRADEMNSNAANALLKSLEEPPANCIFFLVAEASGKMPPTIRSRCRKLDFNTLSDDDLRLAVLNACKLAAIVEPEATKLKTLRQITQGSVRQTLELMGKGLDSYELLVTLFKTLPKMDYAQVHNAAEKLSAPAALPDFEMFFTLMTDLLHRMIRIGAGSGDAPEAEIHIALKFMREDSLAHWAELWETLCQAKRETLALNLDRKNFLLEAFHKVEKTARMTVG